MWETTKLQRAKVNVVKGKTQRIIYETYIKIKAEQSIKEGPQY